MPTPHTKLRPAAAVLFALVLALSGCGGGHSTVPSQVRDAIAKDYPGMAFIPGRLPSGYRYTSWIHSRLPAKTGDQSYELNFFGGSGKNPIYLYLQVQRVSCPAPPRYPANLTHTLHVNGQALKWLHSSEGPYLWRCLTGQGRSLVIFGLSKNAPLQKLAELVGYAVPAN